MKFDLNKIKRSNMVDIKRHPSRSHECPEDFHTPLFPVSKPVDIASNYDGCDGAEKRSGDNPYCISIEHRQAL
jgi:hypothetical protein